LLAADGSSGSNDAARLVRSMIWPADTVVELLSAVDARAWIPPGPGVPGTDVLVLCSRGGSGLTRFLPGSVARNVVSGSTASTLIVREPTEMGTDKESAAALPVAN
jgi:nucleotide-binding universal stress UspA family protein